MIWTILKDINSMIVREKTIITVLFLEVLKIL